LLFDGDVCLHYQSNKNKKSKSFKKQNKKMKTVKVTIATAILFVTMFTTSAFAKNPVAPTSAPAQIQNDGMQKLVEENLMLNAELFEEKTTVNVEFIVNENNEVIITTTNNEYFDASFKQIFNYKKLPKTSLVSNQIYTMSVTVQ
jgi:hypothetical protein